MDVKQVANNGLPILKIGLLVIIAEVEPRHSRGLSFKKTKRHSTECSRTLAIKINAKQWFANQDVVPS